MLNEDMMMNFTDIQYMVHMTAPATGVSTTTHPQDFGVVTRAKVKITSLEEKLLNPKSDITNAGAYLFNKDTFEKLRKTRLLFGASMN